jgi:hypothetical protein
MHQKGRRHNTQTLDSSLLVWKIAIAFVAHSLLLNNLNTLLFSNTLLDLLGHARAQL